MSFPSGEWADRVAAALEDDDQFQRYAARFDSTIRVEVGDEARAFAFADGRVETVHEPTYTAYEYAIRGPEEAWSKLLAETPPPGYQNLIAAWFAGDLRVEGDLERTVQEIRPLNRLIEVCRAVER